MYLIYLHAFHWLWNTLGYVQYGNTGCGAFKRGIQNSKDFWLKINCSWKKLPNLENWSSGKLSKSAKIFYVKNHRMFLSFFLLKNTNLGAHFLFLTFLTTSIFKSLYFLKWCPNFDSSPLLQFNNFTWLQLIFCQKSH